MSNLFAILIVNERNDQSKWENEWWSDLGMKVRHNLVYTCLVISYLSFVCWMNLWINDKLDSSGWSSWSSWESMSRSSFCFSFLFDWSSVSCPDFLYVLGILIVIWRKPDSWLASGQVLCLNIFLWMKRFDSKGYLITVPFIAFHAKASFFLLSYSLMLLLHRFPLFLNFFRSIDWTKSAITIRLSRQKKRKKSIIVDPNGHQPQACYFFLSISCF